MSDRPRLLDLFCGAGGCAWGYRMAGFDVVGVDIESQRNYPFEFQLGDALYVLDKLVNGDQWSQYPLSEFAAIHASPPCQSYSDNMKHLAKPQPMLIEPVRELLEATGLPWVIENVEGAPLPSQSTLDGRYGVELCGTMFGLPVWRHRLFECSFPVEAPSGCSHRGRAMNPHNGRGRDRIYSALGRQDPELPWKEAMGVGWMDRYEAREAVPPAMTHFMGRRLAAVVRGLRQEETQSVA